MKLECRYIPEAMKSLHTPQDLFKYGLIELRKVWTRPIFNFKSPNIGRYNIIWVQDTINESLCMGPWR